MFSRIQDKIVSPIRSTGGKSKMAKTLGMLMPTHFDDGFYEPFCGSAAMSFYLMKLRRLHASKCFISDIDDLHLNFFKVMRSDPYRLTSELMYKFRQYEQMPYSTFITKDVKASFSHKDPFQRAWAFYAWNKMTYRAKRDYECFRLNFNLGARYQDAISAIPFFGEMLQGATIQMHSYEDALNAACSTGGFVFMDPPYEGDVQDLYNCEFNLDDYADNCNAAAANCQMMITLNDSERNRERFNDWNVYSHIVHHAHVAEFRPELIILNYVPSDELVCIDDYALTKLTLDN